MVPEGRSGQILTFLRFWARLVISNDHHLYPICNTLPFRYTLTPLNKLPRSWLKVGEATCRSRASIMAPGGSFWADCGVFPSSRNKLEFILSVIAITVAIIFVATNNGLADDL